MKEETALVLGILVGLMAGIPLGWILANIVGRQQTALVLERSKETGEITAIIPVRVPS